MNARHDSSPDWDLLLLRERGSHDWRMIPVALSVWASCLITHAVFTEFPGLSAVIALMVLCMGTALFIGLVLCVGTVWTFALMRITKRVRPMNRCPRKRRIRLRCDSWAVHVLVPLSAGLLAVVSMTASEAMIRHDSAMVAVQGGAADVSAVVRIDTSPIASSLRQAECQADIMIRSVVVDGVGHGSAARARLFSSGRGCDALRQGSMIQVTGSLSRARYGRSALWLVSDGARIRRVHEPNMLMARIGMMHDAFFRVTNRLSDQGRVLVPGMTIGLLGQDHVDQDHVDSARSEPVNETYARLLEERFRRAGIMHLMAVSGGHFALVGTLVRRCARVIHLPRYPAAFLQIGCFILLADAMYPSDSVRRAVVMGSLLAVAWMRGRPPQALSALSWTTVIVLLVDPQMARSFGFALSCSAVLGIVLCGAPMARALKPHMPAAVAEAMAMTVCAQSFTLPIQVLMEPELPMLSIPANLLVAPFVGAATLFGLAGMALAPVNEAIAYVLVWVSSQSTGIMERCALWLGGDGLSTVAWPGGILGAVTMAAVEIAAVCALLAISRVRTRRRDTGHGVRWDDPLWSRARRWLRETLDAFR